METQFKATNMPVKRFPAVSADRVAKGEFQKEFVKPQGLADRTKKLSAAVAHGTIGCFLSHVQVLQRLMGELGPDEFGLIMEDDLIIPSDWQMRVAVAMRSAPTGFDLLKFSGWGHHR